MKQNVPTFIIALGVGCTPQTTFTLTKTVKGVTTLPGYFPQLFSSVMEQLRSQIRNAPAPRWKDHGIYSISQIRHLIGQSNNLPTESPYTSGDVQQINLNSTCQSIHGDCTTNFTCFFKNVKTVSTKQLLFSFYFMFNYFGKLKI